MTQEPKRLTVLITNLEMTERSGTVTYVRDLALQLQRMGHRPIVFSPKLGTVAQELIHATVPVVDDLAQIGVQPDVIHGHHHIQTMMALAHFPRTPAIFICHDWMTWYDVPPRFPRILRYCAVDDTCLDKLISMNGIAEATTRVLFNAVDLERFRPRPPLPPKPGRAAVFTNYRYDVAPVREACRQLGIELDEIGAAFGTPTNTPEQLLPKYDLVFAKARAAMEAMAVGCAVVVCDYRGVAGLVRPGNFDELRRLNFGARSLRHPHETERLVREIERYDAGDAAQVSTSIRRSGGLDALAADFIELYEEVIEQYAQQSTDIAEEGRAMALYLGEWNFSQRYEWERHAIARRIPLPLIKFAQRLLVGTGRRRS